MPLYALECTTCGGSVEIFASVDRRNDSLDCTFCCSGALRRVIKAPVIRGETVARS